MRNALIRYSKLAATDENWWSEDETVKFGNEFKHYLSKKIYFIERRDKTDFTIFKNKFGYELPNDIKEYINLFWHPYVKGFYKLNECIILFSVIKYNDESGNDVLYHENGIIQLAEEWHSVFGGDISNYLPIGWLDYTGRYILYNVNTDKIYVEKFGYEGTPSELPIANSLKELISNLKIRS